MATSSPGTRRSSSPTATAPGTSPAGLAASCGPTSAGDPGDDRPRSTEVAEASATWQPGRRARPEIAARRAGDVAARAGSWSRPGAARRAFDEVRGPGGRPAGAHRRAGPAPRSAATPSDLRLLRNADHQSAGSLVDRGPGWSARCCCAAGSCCPCSGCGPGCARWPAAGIEEEVLIDGPPEVAAIGRDAESMRRRIVAELEAARAATEALTQHSPVVTPAAQRADRRTRTADAGRPGRSPALVLSAEGVLAGDWWEALRRARRQHRAGARRRVRARRRGGPGRVRLQAADHRPARQPTSTSATAFALAAAAPRRRRRALPVLPRGRRRPGRAASCPGSTPATRPGLVVDRQHRAGSLELGADRPADQLGHQRLDGRPHARSAPTTCCSPAPTGCSRPATPTARSSAPTGCSTWCAACDRWTPDEAVAECREAVRRFARRRTPRRRDLRGADAGPAAGAAAGLTGIRDRVPRLGHRWHSGGRAAQPIIIS